MTATLAVTPTTAAPGSRLDLDGAAWDSKGPKFALTTTNAIGKEVGLTTNTNRVRRDGSFHVGINAPLVLGPAAVTCYQGTTKVTVPITVANVVAPPVIPPVVPDVQVRSVTALLTALMVNAYSVIEVMDGTYAIKGSAYQAVNSLWIGGAYAGRTNPVTVRAQTPGGVIFDAGGGDCQGISFHEGAHHQTWDGFAFANGVTDETGVITSGGYATPAAHDITMRNIRIAGMRGANPTNTALDHAIYIAGAPGGVRGLLFEDFDIDAAGLATGLHLYAHNVNGPHDSIFRRFTIRNARQSVMLWDSSMHDILLEDFTITNSAEHALSYNHPGQRITLRRVVSTGTRSGAPLDAPEGQAGLTLESCAFG